MSRWFCLDRQGDIYEEFKTRKEALEFAKECIQEYADDDTWPQEVLDGAIKVGKITHESTMTNQRQAKPKRYDFVCDCEMVIAQ